MKIFGRVEREKLVHITHTHTPCNLYGFIQALLSSDVIGVALTIILYNVSVTMNYDRDWKSILNIDKSLKIF